MRTPNTLARTLERAARRLRQRVAADAFHLSVEGSVEEVTEHQPIIKTIGHRLDALSGG